MPLIFPEQILALMQGREYRSEGSKILIEGEGSGTMRPGKPLKGPTEAAENTECGGLGQEGKESWGLGVVSSLMTAMV